MLARLCSKSFKLGFRSMWTKNFQMYKLGLEKTEKPKIKLATFVRSLRTQGNSRKTSTSALSTTLKLLIVWITTNCENSSRDRNTGLSYPSSEKSVCRSRSNSYYQTWNNELVPNRTGNKYIKVVYCHPASLTSMQSTAFQTHKLESRLPGKISTMSDMQMIPL